ETELMDAAQRSARQRLPASERKYADAALSRARKLGRTHAISPYRAFDFFARCVAEPQTVGAQVAWLGLWPIDTHAGLDSGDLVISAHMVERLLLPAGAGSTIAGRVATLILPDSAA